jgi:radical SAM superfamily enzyme YgiQ (UPF0313 family)
MKVMLFFPPHWTPAMPHLALPSLAAHLRAHGVQVIQRDLNLETFERVLTQEYLTEAVNRVRETYGGPQAHRRPTGPHPPAERVRWALTHGPWLAGQVEDAVRTIRSDAFLDGPTGVAAFEIVAQSLEVASLPFYPASLDLTAYLPPAPVDSSRSLLQLVADGQRNLFLDLFARHVIPDIVREAPDVVGISIPTLGQMLAGLTLAYLVKQAKLPCHVTVGGPHVTMLREELPRVPALFDLFDSAVVFEGETPLLRLVEALDGNGNLSVVPNLIHPLTGIFDRNGSRIQVNACAGPEEIERLPLPDFDGLPLDRYPTPKLVLPLATSRGCYHGRCAFCNVGYGGPAAFRQLRGEQVVAQMTALQDKYGVCHIFFADEVISPRNLREMSAGLEALGSPLHWCGCVRFEKALTGELLEAMARGGCRMLLFGLETASEPIMQRMVKGTQREQVSRILREGARAGIWNHTFFFFGFPGETIEHAQETVNFVYEHGDAIHSASPGTFVLERYAPAYRSPEKYGIKRIVRQPDRDLAIYFDYEVASGMDERMAALVESRFVDALPEKRFGHFYANDVYRFLYASHLYEWGVPFPPWLAEERG